MKRLLTTTLSISIITLLFSPTLLCMSAVEKIQQKEQTLPSARSSLLDRAQASGKTLKTRPQTAAREPANKIIYKMQEGAAPHEQLEETAAQPSPSNLKKTSQDTNIFQEDVQEQNRSDLAEVNINTIKESAEAAKKINEKYEQVK